MSFELKGNLHARWDTKVITDKFTTREFAIEIPNEKYPQVVKFQLINDRCDLVDNLKKGEEITISFDIKGRVHDGKVYNNLVCWKIDSEKEGQAQPTAQPVEVDDDDLPF